MERTGEVKEKKADNVFADNALKTSTSPRILRDAKGWRRPCFLFIELANGRK
jgi:hypothetical protein